MSQLLPKLSKYIPLVQRRVPPYPLYLKGNKQFKVFLPLFWMKMIKKTEPSPKNYAFFHVHLQMTENDIRQYLEKIYNVKSSCVKLKTIRGEMIKANDSQLMEQDNIKEATVILEENFTFPDIFEGSTNTEKRDKMLLENEKIGKNTRKTKNNVSQWFY